MKEFAKPNVVVSKCLGFAHCRYNGEIIAAPFLQRMQPHVNFQTVCPEVEIGLGVPRESLRIVAVEGQSRLIQPATGLDVTGQMHTFADTFLGSLTDVDGFILKNRSPSCGLNDVKIYASTKKGAAASRGQGFFGAAVLERFPRLAVEDEGRLRNFRIREHFLTQIFTRAAFRPVKQSGRMSELIRFQSENKLLLMAYSPAELKTLGQVVANPEKRPFDALIAEYEQHLLAALTRAPQCTADINVLMHALGYFSDELSGQEKTFFLEALQRYRNGKLPASTIKSLMSSWIVRFDQDYLMQQTFFAPYPEDLVEITDSGKEMACLMLEDE